MDIFKECDRDLLDYLKKDPKVLIALQDFTKTQKDELLEVFKVRISPETMGPVTMNGQTFKTKLSFGYVQKKKQKGPNSFRMISIPTTSIKNVQSYISQRLSRVPISTAATGGEVKMSHIYNAMKHRDNPYMYVADIESAFPSVKAERIHKTLVGTLSKLINISYPHLNHEQRDRFIRGLTALTSYKDELPQGASTSTRLLNIVMANTDKDIAKFLANDESGLIDPMYSRYIDDVTVSCKEYSLVQRHNELAGKVIQGLTNIDYVLLNSDASTTELQSILGEISELFRQLGPSIGDTHQALALSKEIQKINSFVSNIYESNTDNILLREKCQLLLNDIEEHGGIGDKYTHQDMMRYVQNNIRKILINNGRGVKKEKEHIWYPGSHRELREVTGITIDPEGKLGIAKAKMEKFIEFCKTSYKKSEELAWKYKKKDGSLHTARIVATLNGYRKYIELVRGKGNLPSDFAYHHKKAMECYKDSKGNAHSYEQVIMKDIEASIAEGEDNNTPRNG